MDPSTAVNTSAAISLGGFAVVIFLLLFLIAKWKWHVFFALLIPIMLFGILPGVQQNNFIDAFESGFGNTLGSIGVVIVLGSIIAEALKHTGAIQVITRSMVNLVGSNRMPLALTLTGFIIGIAIFSDVAYVILNPLVHSAARTMNVGIAVMSTGLVGALQLTHAIVPPTPGPLAAAAILGADIGRTIIFGGIACLFGSLACWAWGVFIAGPRIKTMASDEFEGVSINDLDEDGPSELPSTLSSYTPIVIPIVLIGTQSVVSLIFEEGHMLRTVFLYLGWPVVALSIGVWLAYRNIKSDDDREKAKDAWVEAALKTSAMILVVTGLGGSLSAILRGTPAVDFIAALFTDYGLPTILLPFVIGIIGNMITGSTTVGVITAASLVAPMLASLSLSPEAAMLSGASGSVIIKYVNSSYFWVCTSLSRLSVPDAVFSYGGATLVGGIVSFLTVCAMWGIGLI
ncbi:MAG: gluconate:proton symporter [Gammaproteobacteria bacterium]|jgi:GntP family gluconate:H+ symporter|nr:gluconate:proton symporter [Gammaproteobacteria bacterium]HJN94870.1 GntP family permease [Gammaproteobacteria bacterium]|tara:strand:+ start:23805 stop:25178 length:1374 start_codon:yes stop_codon:yes gene_type:complete